MLIFSDKSYGDTKSPSNYLLHILWFHEISSLKLKKWSFKTLWLKLDIY